MIAYLFWHRAYPTTTVEQYEDALMRFQQRLGQQQPPGFGGSASFRVAALPWLGNQPGYEDWCLLDGSWALDPLNAFAVAGAVMSAHDAAAAQMEEGHGGLYALVWANPLCRSGRQQSGCRARGAFSGGRLSRRCNFRERHYGGGRWCSDLAGSSLSSCRPVSMSPHQQAGRRWPLSACASTPVDTRLSGHRSHSASFDHRRRPETLRTAMAMAFFCPTNTTSRFPLVTPV